MKKIVSIALVVFMALFLFSSCGGNSSGEENASTIIANYSINNSEDSKDFIVEVQDLGGVYSDLYDKNGLYVKFKGGSDKIYDADGNEIVLNPGKTWVEIVENSRASQNIIYSTEAEFQN